MVSDLSKYVVECATSLETCIWCLANSYYLMTIDSIWAFVIVTATGHEGEGEVVVKDDAMSHKCHI